MIALFMSFAPGILRAGEFHKEFTVSPGKRLTMDLQTGGTIHIVGTGDNRVNVSATFEGRDADECVVEANESSSGVDVTSHFETHRRNRSSDVRFEITVPEKFDLELQTMGGGITIEQVEGEISGKTMGGKLALSHLKGSLDLTTMGGPITVRSSEVEGRVKTMGGEVRIEDVTGNLDASSQGGNVVETNVTRTNGSSTGKKVSISTMGGNIDVNEAPAGADVHTMGGDIHIHSAAGFAKARTMGGSITIDAVDGWVDATTMGGDVAITMTGDPAAGLRRDVTIRSMHGDITLTVPSGLSMDFDIDLAFTRDSEKNYSIISDFAMNQETSPDWEENSGTLRKHIHGTGSIAGGKNRITIRTVNGDIYVKKGSS